MSVAEPGLETQISCALARRPSLSLCLPHHSNPKAPSPHSNQLHQAVAQLYLASHIILCPNCCRSYLAISESHRVARGAGACAREPPAEARNATSSEAAKILKEQLLSTGLGGWFCRLITWSIKQEWVPALRCVTLIMGSFGGAQAGTILPCTLQEP